LVSLCTFRERLGLWVRVDGMTKTPAEGLMAWQAAYGFGVIWIASLFLSLCLFLLKRSQISTANYVFSLSSFFLVPTRLFFTGARFGLRLILFTLSSGRFFPLFFTW